MVKILVYTNAPGCGFGYGSGEHLVSREIADKMVKARCAELLETPVETTSIPELPEETAEIPTPTPPRPKRKRKR